MATVFLLGAMESEDGSLSPSRVQRQSPGSAGQINQYVNDAIDSVLRETPVRNF